MLLHRFPIWNKFKTMVRLTKDGRLSLKRASNLILVNLSLALKQPKPWGKPYMMLIEPTNLCNLRCPMCPTGNGTMTRAKGFMSFETFKKIIDEMGDYLLTLTLMNYGEPFLNKDACKMIRYAKAKNINVVTCTNGHYFETKESAMELVKSGIDTITIALDGATAETQLKYRVNSDFEKVLTSIKNVVTARNSLGLKKPTIKMQFILMKHNEHEIDKIRKIAKEFGVDALSIKTAWVNNKAEAEKFLPTDKKWWRYDVTEEGIKWRVPITNSCPKLWNSTLVNWDGSIVPCCNDMYAKHVFGNLNEAGIKNVWNSKRYESFRKQVVTDKKKIPICSNCPSNMDITIEERMTS